MIDEMNARATKSKLRGCLAGWADRGERASTRMPVIAPSKRPCEPSPSALRIRRERGRTSCGDLAGRGCAWIVSRDDCRSLRSAPDSPRPTSSQKKRKRPSPAASAARLGTATGAKAATLEGAARMTVTGPARRRSRRRRAGSAARPTRTERVPREQARWSSARAAYQLAGAHDGPRTGLPTNSGRRMLVLGPDHPPTRGVARWSSAWTTHQLGRAHAGPRTRPPTNSGGRMMVLGPDHLPTRGVARWSSDRTTHQLGGSHDGPRTGPPTNSGERTMVPGPDHLPTPGGATCSSIPTTHQPKGRRESLRARHHRLECVKHRPSPVSNRDRARPGAFSAPAQLASRSGEARTPTSSSPCPRRRAAARASPPPFEASAHTPRFRPTVTYPT
jgi:hypothetical protein